MGKKQKGFKVFEEYLENSENFLKKKYTTLNSYEIYREKENSCGIYAIFEDALFENENSMTYSDFQSVSAAGLVGFCNRILMIYITDYE